MVGWKAVVDAGTDYVMTNNNVGVTDGVYGFMDSSTYTLLRDELGYDGVICLDWPMGLNNIMGLSGVTDDGVDISTLSEVERYALILNTGIDMFSCGGVIKGTDFEAYAEEAPCPAYPDLIVQAVEEGLVTEENLNEHVARVMRNKFELGLFEDPYSDWEDALALIGSEAYQEEQFALMDNDDINAARRSEITEMEDQLMVESTILLKNENNILPLSQGTKMYVDATAEDLKTRDTEALGAFGR